MIAPGRQRGQMIVLFSLFLVVILAFTGLLVDGGMAWSNRRAAQSAADTAALNAAKTAVVSGTDYTQSARDVATANDFPMNYTDCSGTAQSDGVVVNRPPATGPHAAGNDPNADNYVEVITKRAQQNYFSAVVGQSCWIVSARAVAEIAIHAAAGCSFCSLNHSTDNHTLLLQNGATLRVDGDINVNSSNGGPGPACAVSKWQVCGDGFDIFGSPANPPAYISAKTISVTGGWETHDNNVVVADAPLTPDYSTIPPTYSTCPQHPNPPSQTQTSNVCIHEPAITDPLNDPAHPDNMIPTPNGADFVIPNVTNCPDGTVFPSPIPGNGTKLTITANATICPGIYYGGVSITGGTTTMLPGLYYISGNGFAVSGSASLDGSAGVMIYNSSGGGGLDIAPDPDLAGDPDPSLPTPIVTLTSNDYTATIGEQVTYTFHVNQNGTSKLSGTVDFYDGSTKSSSVGSATCPTLTKTNSGNFSATCKQTYGVDGTHGIAAVFISSDSLYNNVEAILAPPEVVSSPAGTISISTTGNVKLSGVKSTVYQGIVIFHDRTSDRSVTLSPGSGLAACSPTDLITVNGVTGPAWALMQPPPAPCGALGGVEGTIYAPNEDALVTLTASGVADLQIIAGRILITSGATARFSFTASKFAGGRIRLVE